MYLIVKTSRFASVKNIVAYDTPVSYAPYSFPSRTPFLAHRAQSCSKHLVLLSFWSATRSFWSTQIVYHKKFGLSSFFQKKSSRLFSTPAFLFRSSFSFLCLFLPIYSIYYCCFLYLLFFGKTLNFLPKYGKIWLSRKENRSKETSKEENEKEIWRKLWKITQKY